MEYIMEPLAITVDEELRIARPCNLSCWLSHCPPVSWDPCGTVA